MEYECINYERDKAMDGWVLYLFAEGRTVFPEV
jgi:hypothetical protein